MKTVGMFEAKTRLSEICEQVAATREPVTVTRRGKPLVRIGPVDPAPTTIRERREAYLAVHGPQEPNDAVDFSPPPRADDISTLELED